MPIDLDSLTVPNNRRKNLRALELRLARNAELWIANEMEDEIFFRKLANMQVILNNNKVLKYSELYKYYDSKGEIVKQYENALVVPLLKNLNLQLGPYKDR